MTAPRARSGSRDRVLLAIADLLDAEDSFAVHQAATATGLALSTVQWHLNQLAARGLVTRPARRNQPRGVRLTAAGDARVVALREQQKQQPRRVP